MNRTEIAALYADASAFGGKTVTVCGWVRSIRDSKALGFIDLNDGSCFKACRSCLKTASGKFPRNHPAECRLCPAGYRGIAAHAPGKAALEIHAQKIEVEGASTPDYPLQKKRHTMEYLRTIAHLRPRTNTFSAAFRVRSAAAFAIHRFFQERGFVYAHTPLITGSDCEGAGRCSV